jgi:hypothetical protein
VSCRTIAQSFSPFLAGDGWQVRRPSWIWATSLCYILLNKLVALVGSGRRTCHPSHDKKGLKDWASVWPKKTAKANGLFCRRSVQKFYPFLAGKKDKYLACDTHGPPFLAVVFSNGPKTMSETRKKLGFKNGPGDKGFSPDDGELLKDRPKLGLSHEFRPDKDNRAVADSSRGYRRAPKSWSRETGNLFICGRSALKIGQNKRRSFSRLNVISNSVPSYPHNVYKQKWKYKCSPLEK